MTKLDRLARSLRDAKDIVDELTRREVKLSIGGSIHDPTESAPAPLNVNFRTDPPRTPLHAIGSRRPLDEALEMARGRGWGQPTKRNK